MNTPEINSRNFPLLKPANMKNTAFNLEMRVEGYNAVMHYIAHLVKVSIMALEGQDGISSPYIPEPGVNIAGVLELILNMIPYEETDLLDELYKAHLNQETYWEKMSFEEMSLRIVPPEVWEGKVILAKE
ncbi:MAG TPA: hypothetical protein VGB43_07920 [Flavobacterium sp.]|jgi:hypothetical protein